MIRRLLNAAGLAAGPLLFPAGASPALGPPPGTGCGHSSCTRVVPVAGIQSTNGG